MSKQYDISAITAIALITSAVSTVRAEVTQFLSIQASSQHRLCIMVEEGAQTESLQYSVYTDSPDFNMVHSEAIIHQSDMDDEHAVVTTSDTSTHLLERPNCSPTQFMARIDF
jgi:hypothetical protein